MRHNSTVYIVDPDERHAAAVAVLIDQMGLTTERFAAAEPLLASLQSGRPGCLLAEMDLPGIDGVDLLRLVADSANPLPVIFMSASVDVSAIVPALRAGAVDFLKKPCKDLALWDSLQLAIERDAAFRNERETRADVAARLAQLTDEERSVMDLLLANKPNRTIAGRLDVSQRTVNFRRASVLKKMGVGSLIELASKLARADYPLGGGAGRNATGDSKTKLAVNGNGHVLSSDH